MLTQEEIKKIAAVVGLIIGLTTVFGMVSKYISNETRRRIAIEQNEAQIQQINQRVDQVLTSLDGRIATINEKFDKLKIGDIEFRSEMKYKISSSDRVLLDMKGEVDKIKDEMTDLKVLKRELESVK